MVSTISGPPPKTTQERTQIEDTLPIPGEKLKFLIPPGIEPGPSGWKAGNLPTTPRRRILENTKDDIYTHTHTHTQNSEMRTTENTTPITARPHHTFQNTAQNKEYEKLQISSRVLTRFSRVFLNSGSYGCHFLLHRETLISQSFKKIGDSVTVHSPC